MVDFSNLDEVTRLLSQAQTADKDNRDKVREVTHFLEKPDGQWEPSIVNNMKGRPRYTFDKCNPVVDSIAGEMEQADFAIKVRPAGGDATKDLAKLYDGMVRNIENLSNAPQVYASAGRQMVASGFDCWRVVQDWADGDSFEQDLLIKKIGNAVDRVWFDTASELQDRSDSNWAFVLQTVTKMDYEDRWTDGSGMSVNEDRDSSVYEHKPEQIIVGEFLYKKKTTKELVLMSDNAVYEVDDSFEKVMDELKAAGTIEVRRRKRESHIVYTRLFDGNDWLGDEKETVFSYIPVIPTYGNFKISENKVIYRGVVNNLMDAQRVYNYAQSRAIEEGALAPRKKMMMTREQAAKDKETLQTMNTNADPVQTYTHVATQPQPYELGGAQINMGLTQTASDMAGNIVGGSGIFAANQGDSPNQSGYAIELQQQKGDNSTIKYFSSQEVAICHTAKILILAIPKVYDTKRMVRVINEDGSFGMETINDEIFDEETKKTVSLNDLRKGKYDVTCDVGPAFKNRQQETARAFLEAAAVDPSLLTLGKDIWLKNLTAPGFDMMAERARKEMFKAGLIPDDQMTDDEKEEAQQILQEAEQSSQAPDPMIMAVLEQTQANTADIMSKAEERQNKALLEAEKLRQSDMKLALQAQESQRKQDMEFQKMMVDNLNKNSQTLNNLVNALGGKAPPAVEQSELVAESQDDLGS